MMEGQTIRMVDRISTVTSAPVHDSWNLVPGRGAKVTRWVLRLMARAGLVKARNEFMESVTFKELRKDDVARQIMESQEVLDRAYRHNPVTVYVGPDENLDLMQAVEFRHEVPIGINGQHTMLGLNVIVVPWMRGVLVI